MDRETLRKVAFVIGMILFCAATFVVLQPLVRFMGMMAR